MAYRTQLLEKELDFSKFGERLWGLMFEKGIDTPGKLASALLKQNLVEVRQGHYLSDEENEKRKHAVDSVTKKITKHIHADNANKVQGEFILAYCKFFECSADYLLGNTSIKSVDLDVRKICEKTGLSETVVNGFVESIGDAENHYCWNAILESGLFGTLPYDWFIARSELVKCREALNQANDATESEKVKNILKNEEPGFDYAFYESLRQMKNDTLVKAARSHYASYYGMLSKISSDVIETLNNLTDTVFDEKTERLEA